MAEAVVEDRPQPPQRFYCHVCSVEVQAVNSDFTCPLCSGGFIEELPAATDAPPEDIEMIDANTLNDLDMIRDEIATLFSARAGSRPPDSDGGGDDDPQGVGGVGAGGGGSAGGGGAGGVGAGVGVNAPGRGGRRNRRRLRMQNFDRFDNILLEILQTLSGGNEAALGNASMFFMGNPGDYAWGREGIDTIVTQLLNQMDTTGPPPLPKEKIDEIPNVDITEDQVEHKLQCSVCWEDFKLNESVRKLPCLHVYHENCIVPWLELHGTCPICRKSLTPDGPDVSNSLRNVASAFIRNEDQQQQVGISGATTNNSINGTPSTITTNTSSSTTSSHPQDQHLIEDTIFNSPFNIPISLSRIFSQQPGTSHHHHHHQQQLPIHQLPMGSTASTAGSVGVSGCPQIVQSPFNLLRQQNNDTGGLADNSGILGGGIRFGIGNGAATNGGGGGGGASTGQSGTSSTSSGGPPRTTQNDVFKFEDGNVEYDFD